MQVQTPAGLDDLAGHVVADQFLQASRGLQEQGQGFTVRDTAGGPVVGS